MRVLVVNAGSSSLKLAVMDDLRKAEGSAVERWDGAGDLEPVQVFLDEVGTVDAVGHRVVHGGPRLTDSLLVDDEVLEYLDEISPLAPLHNPRSVAAVREVRRLLPGLPTVVCFDTTFHAGLPEPARTYALPHDWNERWALRRYGFHGLSHAYAVRRAAELIGTHRDELRIVSCHLGAGASLSAVRYGSPVDTTMGFTPLAGLVMATRSGSVDPGLLVWLVQEAGIGVDELAAALDQRSGLKGLSGTSGDIRDVLAARAAGDPRAVLAFDVFAHRLRREIGAMAASAGGVDLLVLTGGVGEHSPEVRAEVGVGLGHLGVEIDSERNESTTSDSVISPTSARVSTVVVTASEETQIARETERLVAAPG